VPDPLDLQLNVCEIAEQLVAVWVEYKICEPPNPKVIVCDAPLASIADSKQVLQLAGGLHVV
jgi:hypothetical protein